MAEGRHRRKIYFASYTFRNLHHILYHVYSTYLDVLQCAYEISRKGVPEAGQSDFLGAGGGTGAGGPRERELGIRLTLVLF